MLTFIIPKLENANSNSVYLLTLDKFMSKSEAYVSFQGVQKSYDGESLVVKDLNLDAQRGEFLTMLGPSGSGKTTCLMMLAGF